MTAPADELLVRQEPDILPARRLVAIFVAALLVGGGGVLVSGRMLPASHAAEAPPRAPHDIGHVDQTVIGADDYGLRLRREQRQRLETYGWIDRDAGVARIPIERAMRLVGQGNGR